jgi:pyrroloquinoline-quinone synthase
MEVAEFFTELDDCIRRHDLLYHPFYQAWTGGALTREDIYVYATDYYHQVEAFPRYLSGFLRRLPQGQLRQAVLENLDDELGSGKRPAHATLWFDFAEGMAGPESNWSGTPSVGIRNLVWFFHAKANNDKPHEVLACLYAYESQVPRIAEEKLKGLRTFYRADDRACEYFSVHVVADVLHAHVWREQLQQCLERNPDVGNEALHAAESAACVLWRALDSIESDRIERAAAHHLSASL